MLEVRNLSVSYGRHRALEGVGLAVNKGEICVILGANGAGKSTLLKAIAGMVAAEPGGEVVMNGRPVAGLKPHRIVEEGIALVPEGRGIFGDLTVAENLQLGAFATRARADEAATLRQVYALFPRLAERKRQVARTMSGGEQQMVAIGRALMSRPDILMLDEPSLGLSPLLSRELFRSLAEVAKTGVGILLVEQNARQSLRIAERGYLIENGHVTGENTAKALMNDPAVISAYLGGAAGRAAKPQISLPPPIRLPLGVDAIGRAVGELAGRAGRIQQAFVRAMRRGSDLPSAFVGRYDPKVGADPWEEIAAAPPPPVQPARAPAVSADARALGQSTAEMARRATERLAAHVRAERLSAHQPSAFVEARRHRVEAEPSPIAAVPSHQAGAAPDARRTIDDPADLARRASERLAAHVAKMRAAARPPSAFVEARFQPARIVAAAETPPSRANGAHALIGHNSAGLDVEDETEAPMASVSAPAPAPSPSIADLVARAASIHSAHVAERRRTLTAFTIPAGKAGSDDPHDKSAAKKRKKHKET